MVGLRRTMIFPTVLGPDFAVVQQGPLTMSTRTWSAIRNTAFEDLAVESHMSVLNFSQFGQLNAVFEVRFGRSMDFERDLSPIRDD